MKNINLISFIVMFSMYISFIPMIITNYAQPKNIWGFSDAVPFYEAYSIFTIFWSVINLGLFGIAFCCYMLFKACTEKEE